jgi:hypothetical protein
LKIKIELCIIEGGMKEFTRTGTYPRFLIFYVVDWNKKWRVKLRSDYQKGVLNSNGNPLFEYYFQNGKCKIRELSSSAQNSFYSIDKISYLMRD